MASRTSLQVVERVQESQKAFSVGQEGIAAPAVAGKVVCEEVRSYAIDLHGRGHATLNNCRMCSADLQSLVHFKGALASWQLDRQMAWKSDGGCERIPIDKSVGNLSAHWRGMAGHAATYHRNAHFCSAFVNGRESIVTDHACNWRHAQQINEEFFECRSHRRKTRSIWQVGDDHLVARLRPRVVAAEVLDARSHHLTRLHVVKNV